MIDAPADDRIAELEINLAFQDKLIRELDGLVRALAERLEGCERELVALKAAIATPEPANEKPPHY